MDFNVTFREKNGSVQAIISYKDSSGKWKQKSKQGFKTQKAAKPWISDIVEELEETVNYIDPEHYDDTFEEIFNMYSEHVELYWETNTLINLDKNIRLNFSDLFKKEIKSITSLHIQECVDKMIKKGLKNSTIRKYLVILKTIFKYAIKHKAIKENPVTNIKLPEDKTIEKIKALTKIETELLLDKIKSTQYYLIALVAVTCGLRIGEILAIKWSDINEKNSTITINKQWKVIKKDPITYGEGPVKKQNSNRVVPIPADTLAKLTKYKKDSVIDISGRIFPFYNTNYTSLQISKCFKEHGFDNSIHDLRHTYASRLVAAGLDFQTIAALIGDSVEITIKNYSHFTEDMMTKAKNAVENIF